MVSVTPITLGDLRAALIERCGLDTTDPRASATILNGIINEAVARFDMAEPNGWPWDIVDSGYQSLPAGLSTYAWASTVHANKVRWMLLGDAAGTFKYPLERLTRTQQLDEYPNDSQVGPPRTYALSGVDVPGATEPAIVAYLRPVPDVAYTLRIYGLLPVTPFVADTDPDPLLNDFQIVDWSPIVLEYAAFLVYRARDDLVDAVAAKQAFDVGVLEARRGARRTRGAGIPMRPGALDWDGR